MRRSFAWSAVALLVAACNKTAPSPELSGKLENGVRRVELAVTENGYEPSPITVKSGEALELVITRKTDKTCANEIVIDDPAIKKDLPLNQPVTVAFTPSKTGELTYGCAMDKMIAGKIVVR